MTRTEPEIRVRIIACNAALKQLRGEEMAINSPYYKNYMQRNPEVTKSDYARMLERAIERTTSELHLLQVELRERTKSESQPPPVKIGMKPAQLKPTVKRS